MSVLDEDIIDLWRERVAIRAESDKDNHIRWIELAAIMSVRRQLQETYGGTLREWGQRVASAVEHLRSIDDRPRADMKEIVDKVLRQPGIASNCRDIAKWLMLKEWAKNNGHDVSDAPFLPPWMHVEHPTGEPPEGWDDLFQSQGATL